MNRSIIFSIYACLIFITTMAYSKDIVKIKIQGSTTVNPIVTEAAEILRKEKGWRIFVDTQGGSSGGISAVGEGLIDIGMSSRPIDADDRKKYPDVDFKSVAIGIDGVALVVSTPVWESGVHTVSQKQIQNIYEKRIKNWQNLGGPNTPIVFYNKEAGRGTWSVFADWTYGNHKKAPNISHPEVGSNEETRNKVSFHPSAMSQLSFAWAIASDKIKALSIKTPTGQIISPTLTTLRDGSYPIIRRLYLITKGDPQGQVKEFIDFLLSERGQKLVEKHGYVSI